MVTNCVQKDELPLDASEKKWFIRLMRQINFEKNQKLKDSKTQNNQEIKNEKAEIVEIRPVVKNGLKSFLALFRDFVLVGGDLA